MKIFFAILVVVVLANQQANCQEREESIVPRYGTRRINYTTQYLHLLDHDPLVTERKNEPFTTKVWRCDLRYNDCFLKNRVKYAPFKTQERFAGTFNALVLDVGLAARSLHGLTGQPKPIYGYNGARLRSNGYFPARYVDACMTFSYYWNGAGRKTLKILQRNEETACIFADEIGSSDLAVQHSGQWRDVQLQLDLRYGDAQFVLEFQFDAPDPKTVESLNQQRNYRFDYAQLGNIGIRDFSIGYGVCQRSEANECDVPVVTGTGYRDNNINQAEK